MNLDGRRDGEDPTGVVGGENAIRIILMKAIIFNKRKIKNNNPLFKNNSEYTFPRELTFTVSNSK